MNSYAPGWYAVVHTGYGPNLPPRGPWPSLGEAHDALRRWRARKGEHAGTIEAAHNVRVWGPYPTRAAARAADISTPPPAGGRG